MFIGIKVRIIQARNIRRLDSGGPGPYQSSVFFQSHRDEVLTNYVYSPAIFILTKKTHRKFIGRSMHKFRKLLKNGRILK